MAHRRGVTAVESFDDIAVLRTAPRPGAVPTDVEPSSRPCADPSGPTRDDGLLRASRCHSRGRRRSWSARKRSNSAPISSALGTWPELSSRSVPSRAAVKVSYCCSSAATTAVFSLERADLLVDLGAVGLGGLGQRLGRQVQPGQLLQVLEQRQRGGGVGGLGQVVRHVRGHAQRVDARPRPGAAPAAPRRCRGCASRPSTPDTARSAGGASRAR